MERPLITLIMLIIGVVVAVILAGFYYGWFATMLGGHPDFTVYDVKLYYDSIASKSWGYFKLKNTGTIDITGIEVYVIKWPNGTVPATPYQATLDPNTVPTPTTPLKKGDEVQVAITDLGAKQVGTITLRFKVSYSGAKPTVREYTYRVESP